MEAFLVSMAIFGGIALVASAPALMLAQRRKLSATRRRFLIAIAAFGLLAGVMGFTSEKLGDDCRDSGASARTCHDIGADGFLVLVVIAFVVAALWKAVSIYRY